MSAAVYWLSGEFFLRNRPNGGTAVLLRAIFITLLVLALAAPCKAYLDENTIFWSFSWEQAKKDLGEMIPWAGAIFAGVYAVLYSRFAAQWSYLAGLYNQLMQTCATLPASQQKNNFPLAAWHAAFIEDAIDLHLAEKPMFKSVLIGLLQDGEVVRAFVEGTINGHERLRKLEERLKVSAASPSHTESRSAACLTRAAAESQSAPA